MMQRHEYENICVGFWLVKKKGGVKYSHISAGGHNSLFRRIETKSVRSLWHKSIVIRHSNVLHSYKWHYELGNVRFGLCVCVFLCMDGIFLSIHISVCSVAPKWQNDLKRKIPNALS